MDSNQDITILIVEDSPTQYVTLSYLLEKQGYQYIVKTNGKEALQTVEQQKPDLIISDVFMPEMDGFELCKIIKDDKELKNIPIILMTSVEGVDEIGKGLEAGADNFIYKPYQPEFLLNRIHLILEKKKQVREKNGKSGYQISLGDKEYYIRSKPEQILDLLASSFEDVVRMNKSLTQREIELQVAKEAAELANIKKSKFLATMSHEIRTPMMGITGLLELLSLSRLDSDQQSTLTTIYESSKSLVRIIDDILDFSRIEAGKMEIAAKADSIAATIKKLHQLYNGAANRKGIVLETYCDPAISPALLFDSLRLQQILGNFLNNAIKLTSEGRIILRAELLERLEQSERLRFLVEDTGIGVPPRDLQQLFNPFVEIEKQPAQEVGGVNLEFVISKRLAELMNGSIDINSELNRGTIMILTITFPIADPKQIKNSDFMEPINQLAETLADRRHAPSILDAEKEHSLVCVVDDSPVNHKVLMQQLNSLGYAVEGATGGAEALSMLQSKRYALIFTDCNMPKMSGYELTHKIREYEQRNALKKIPIIACTADAQLDVKQNCLAAGMNDVLVKPVALTDLMRCMDYWLPLPTTPPINRSLLIEIVGEDEKSIQETLKDFKRTSSKSIALLSNAIEMKELNEVMNLAHQLKGACQLVGAKRLAIICQKIEEASRKNDEETVDSYRSKLDQEVQKLEKYLNSL
ncbi:TPA: response regulator [Legionella feeleii]